MHVYYIYMYTIYISYICACTHMCKCVHTYTHTIFREKCICAFPNDQISILLEDFKVRGDGRLLRKQ